MDHEFWYENKLMEQIKEQQKILFHNKRFLKYGTKNMKQKNMKQKNMKQKIVKFIFHAKCRFFQIMSSSKKKIKYLCIGLIDYAGHVDICQERRHDRTSIPYMSGLDIINSLVKSKINQDDRSNYFTMLILTMLILNHANIDQDYRQYRTDTKE